MKTRDGFFEDQTEQRLPLRDSPEETREVALADVDADGDLDVFFANVQAFTQGADPQNRLLINDGNGNFKDVTAAQLPVDSNRSFTSIFMDVDADGDQDILTGNSNRGPFSGLAPYRAYLNDGKDHYTDSTSAIFLSGIKGSGFGILVEDFNGDELLDIYFASRGSGDKLVFRF